MLVALGAAVIFLNVVLLTTTGLKACILVVDRVVEGTLTVDRVHGRIVSSFVLEGVRYSGSTGELQLKQIDLSWNPPALAKKELHTTTL